VSSPSVKERRKDSVADSPVVAVEYPWRMVAGTARTERTAAVLHAEVVMGAASAKRARGAAVNFMVVVFVDCVSKNEEIWRHNKLAVIVHSLLLACHHRERGRQSTHRPHTWSLACEPHVDVCVYFCLV